MPDEGLLIRLDATPASDSWGFVGRVMIGEAEAYRTLRSYATPAEAQQAVQRIVAAALGPLLAGEEWRAIGEATGRTPLREDLGIGLGAHNEPPQNNDPARG